jgi:hypothetical protein
MTSESQTVPLLLAYFLCVCTCMFPIIARQRLSKHIPAVTSMHAAIEELLDVKFLMQSMSYERKVGD